MILIGQYDSPFVRRVGIALTVYGLAFEHRPWSTFGDADRIRPFSPLARVPVLVVGETALTDSHLILAQLDDSAPPGRALMPTDAPGRLAVRRLAGLATGLADAAVSLFYERVLHDSPSRLLVERRGGQLRAAATRLEEAAAIPTPFLCGAALTHADIAVACAMRFVGEAHTGLVPAAEIPALSRRCAALEATEPFRAISQPFIPPA